MASGGAPAAPKRGPSPPRAPALPPRHKRRRAVQSPPPSPRPRPRCLHCTASFHTWSECEGLCVQCWDRHPRKRCPVLAFHHYVPGGFSVVATPLPAPRASPAAPQHAPVSIDAAHVAGVAPAPPASTAQTSAPPPGPSASPRRDQGRRPPETDVDLLPLRGPAPPRPPSPRPPSRPPSRPAEVLRGSARATPPSAELMYSRKWTGLNKQVRDIVRSAENASSPINNGRDRATIDATVSYALEVLKPAILR